jgi:hypothetical protein
MKRLWAPILLAVLVLIFFGHVLFGDRILLHRDLFSFFYPLHHYWIEQVLHGRVPVLNTALNGGQPLFVNPNYSFFYPLSVLYFLFDFDTAWNLTLILHVLWAGLGLFYLSRVLGFSRIAAFSGALTYSFGGPLLSSVSYYISVLGLSWLPWILVLSYKAIRDGGRWIALAALSIASQLLSGEANIITGSWILLLLFILFLWRESVNAKATAMRGSAILLLGVMIACVQILPSLLWIPNSGRAIKLDFELSSAYWSLNPARLMELIVPRFFGNVMSDFALEYWGSRYADSGYPYVFMAYAGCLPLLLAPVAWRNRWGAWAMCIAVACILLSLGRWLPGYRLLYDFIPGFQTLRYPEKFLFFANFGLALAVSAAVTQLPRFKWKQLWPSFVVAASILIVIAAFALQRWPESLSELQQGYQKKALISAGLTVLVATALLVTTLKFPRLTALLTVLILFDLCSYTWVLAQTESRSLLKVPQLIRKIPELRHYPLFHLGEQQADQYFLGGVSPAVYMKEAIHPLLGLNWGVQYGATVDVDRLGWKLSAMRHSWIQQKFPDSQAIDLMRQCGVGRMISLASVNNPQLRLETQISLRGQKKIYVYRLDPPPFEFIRWKEGEGMLQWRIERSDYISIQIKGATGGELIVSRNALPGWKCTLDASNVPCKSTPEGWMQVEVPKGDHRLDVTYRTPGLIAGLILTALATLIVAALLVFG